MRNSEETISMCMFRASIRVDRRPIEGGATPTGSLRRRWSSKHWRIKHNFSRVCAKSTRSPVMAVRVGI